MNGKTAKPWSDNQWQAIIKAAITEPASIAPGLTGTDQSPAFAMRLPAPFASRIDPTDPNDPILLQVLPSEEEKRHLSGDSADPLDEAAAVRSPALLQKYAGRALLITSPACAVHCRYCFRRAFPYEDHRGSALNEAVHAIRNDTSLSEVILSGGDPLSLTDPALKRLLKDLGTIGHLKRLRIHTRTPVVVPQRVSRSLVDLLTATKLPVAIVVHVNHARELDADTERAFRALKSSGVTLLNQTVLLKGINDNLDTQVALAQSLYEQGALPYYLHLADAVEGTHHFRVDRTTAQRLHRKMHAALPGYLLPRLVCEEPGKPGKTLL
jgi:EF-P beta-lysylation protein EpmB